MVILIKTLAERLEHFYSHEESTEIVERIFCRHLHKTKAQLFAMKREEVKGDVLRKIQEDLRWIFYHKPIQYIEGEVSFCGVNLGIEKGVLIPRPETEEWVKWMIKQPFPQGTKVLDVGTGSGCISFGIKHSHPQAYVEAWDMEERPLEVAKKNVERTGLSVEIRKIDILNLSPEEKSRQWDFIVSNPPYICKSEAKDMNANVLLWEPNKALFVEDENPLIFYSALCDLALSTLKKSGGMFVEISEFRSQEVVKLLQEKGFEKVELWNDMFGKPRMIWARL